MRSRTWVLVLAGLHWLACGSDGTGPTPPPLPPPPPPTQPPPPGAKLLVRGEYLTASGQTVSIFHQGTPVRNVTLDVNGVVLADRGSGSYYAAIVPAVPPGGTMTLTLTVGTLRVQGTGVLPITPVLNTPGGALQGQPIPVTWFTTTSPDSFEVGLRYLEHGVLVERPLRVSGDAREAILPTNGIGAAATGLQVYLHALNHGAFTGDVAQGSSLNLRSSATARPYQFGVAIRRSGEGGLRDNENALALVHLGAGAEGATRGLVGGGSSSGSGWTDGVRGGSFPAISP